MTHDEFLVAYLEAGAGAPGAGEHLAACAECRALVAELDDTRAALADPFAWARPAPGVEDAVVSAVLRAAAVAPPRPPAGDHDDRPPEVLDRPPEVVDDDRPPAPAAGWGTVASLATRPRRATVATWVASAVAAAAIVIAVVAVATRPSGPPPSAAPPAVTSTAAPGRGVDVVLTGTELAPQASGRAELRDTASGVWVHLDARGLPRLDNGAFYEAWLRGDKGLVPIGTFHSGENVTLWAGVPYEEFPTLTVTREQADGNQESSGQRVLVGTIGR